MNFELETGWKKELSAELKTDYMKELDSFLSEEKKLGKEIYPAEKDIFNAFNYTPLEQVKVVIIGQDPYHGENQAHGMCFSVKKGVKLPPSLRNIYKELYNDLSIEPAEHGHLEKWANQGVLLLNTVLTVEKGKAGSHQKKGWEKFTDKVIKILNDRENIVFLLWGSPAQKKAKNVDKNKHLILKSVHPSPLSAHRGFFGQHHFSKCNEYLKTIGKKPIDWSIN